MLPSPIGDAYVCENQLSKPQPSFPLDLYLCGRCGHLQLCDVVDPQVLFVQYLYQTTTSPGLVEHFRQYAESVLTSMSLPAGSLIVDIGSNDGTFLKFFHARGQRVLGVDPALSAVAAAKASEIETLPEFFTSALARRIREERGPAAVVTANNVFAHSDTLSDMADGIRELLADDGVFVFEVSYLLDIVEKLLFDTVYHEHLSYHSLRPLIRFLDRHGLQLWDVERIPSKGGSIRGFAQRRNGPRAITSRVGELLTLESQAQLDQLDCFRRFSRSISDAKQALSQMLDQLQHDGQTICGYGASPTTTTLMFQFELNRWLKYLVDDNPLKQGLYSPGWHLPVYPSSDLYIRRPDVVVTLAWNFANAMIQRHAAFLEQGGRFVVPLKELRVVAGNPIGA